ncbi:DUF5819 family protein [Streptomyces sp. ACA25]|uniref:DUF5819 family protein n=1 Tax=Streptomyces sp. ACA25 TaxID=3022596 RepID=UPI002307C766|nr:DUF5819 family protein [Streptomyces sp. ACA25]MDB1086323.1 DUF5819 family protein [Streptomyces sp. ACA25]
MQPIEPSGDPDPARTASARLAALSVPARLIIALAVGVVTVFTAWHLAAVFLFVAPTNTITQEHGPAIRGYVYPEFEQNWKLFAPNPLQRNVAVEARAEIRTADGSTEITEWIDLSAMDFENIRHHLLPSHTAQNELRRAWDFYTNSHDDDGEPTGMRGELSERYVHRIALLRLSEVMDVHEATRIQLRSASTRVAPPPWSNEDIDTSTHHSELDWRTVTTADLPGGAAAGQGER